MKCVYVIVNGPPAAATLPARVVLDTAKFQLLAEEGFEANQEGPHMVYENVTWVFTDGERFLRVLASLEEASVEVCSTYCLGLVFT